MLRAGVTARHAGPEHRRVRRQDPYVAEVDNLGLSGAMYTIDVDVGTPPQTVTIHLDTGSYEMWINPTCETSGNLALCEELPWFNETESSTFKSLGTNETIRYGKGNVTFDYAADDVAIGRKFYQFATR